MCQDSSLIASWIKGGSQTYRVDSTKLNHAFCEAFESVLMASQSDITDGFDNDSLVLERHHKFPRLFLTRKLEGAMQKPLTISIDLVPCFRFSFSENGNVMSFDRQNGKLYLVLKTPLSFDRSLPISYNVCEKSVFLSEPGFIKEGYRLAKALRCQKIDGKLSIICYPGSLQDKIPLDVDFDPEEIITSYQLKSCAISLLQEKEHMHEILMQNTCSQLHVVFAKEIYKFLKNCLVRRTMFPYYEKQEKAYSLIFACVHDDLSFDDQLACCQLNSLRLEMTTTILNYLEKEARIIAVDAVEIRSGEKVRLKAQLEGKIDEMNQNLSQVTLRQAKIDHANKVLSQIPSFEKSQFPTDSRHEQVLKHSITTASQDNSSKHLFRVMAFLCLAVVNSRLFDVVVKYNKVVVSHDVAVVIYVTIFTVYFIQVYILLLFSTRHIVQTTRYFTDLLFVAQQLFACLLAASLLLSCIMLDTVLNLCDTTSFGCFAVTVSVHILLQQMLLIACVAAVIALRTMLTRVRKTLVLLILYVILCGTILIFTLLLVALGLSY